MNLETARIKSLPHEGFYISDFITEDEEDYLLQKASKYTHHIHIYLSTSLVD